MKNIIKRGILFLFLLIVIVSCKKDMTQQITTTGSPPVANAGNDLVIELTCLAEGGSFELDGSGSFDPDGEMLVYSWLPINGTGRSGFVSSTSAKVKIESILPGKYAFQLTVKDAAGLTSKDTVFVTVNGRAGNQKEYNLDLTISDTFEFLNNYQDDPWMDPSYNDVTEIKSNGIITPFGEFNIYIIEYSDSAALSNAISWSYFRIQQGNTNPLFIEGRCLINFKKLIREGGGSFDGTFTITSGSAETCDPLEFAKLKPLSVKGTLDVASRKVELAIKGKIYF